MSTYMLVHGAWHGAWCWYKTIAGLERAGHRFIAPDLPSLGKDKTPVANITLDVWTDSLCKVLDAQPEPVILVGHSRGGILISQVAEQRPEKVKTLVYLCAFLLKDGQALLPVAQEDGTSRVMLHLVVSDDQVHSMVKPEAFKEVYYGECSDEDIALARTLLSPEPLAPMFTPIHITDANFGSVPRVYIECDRDNAIPPRLQKQMYTALPCKTLMSIDTDHSPFFSANETLVSQLLSVA